MFEVWGITKRIKNHQTIKLVRKNQLLILSINCKEKSLRLINQTIILLKEINRFQCVKAQVLKCRPHQSFRKNSNRSQNS